MQATAPTLVEVKIDKLVHGGQGLGELPDGRKVFVWNALPGETVRVSLWRRKRSWSEGVAVEIIEASPHRLAPKEPLSYLGTSPWQIMDFAYENEQKKAILREIFEREKISLPESEFIANEPQYGYRNKMEYSFWADDSGLSLALFNRGSHQKQAIKGSALAIDAIDRAANDLLVELNRLGIRGSQLKSLVIRCSQAKEVAAALFVKDPGFVKLAKPSALTGLAVYFSNPKSPASIITKELYKEGDIELSDLLLDRPVWYDVNSFFQVNVPVYNLVLKQIEAAIDGSLPLLDMYAGVGSIGLSVVQADQALSLVEIDDNSIAMAQRNVLSFGRSSAKVIKAGSETALSEISPETQVLLDPPRAGLAPKLVEHLLSARPPLLVYLSCNPSTQARDVAKLMAVYDIVSATGYNFFPRTPHIEHLIIMKPRSETP